MRVQDARAAGRLLALTMQQPHATLAMLGIRPFDLRSSAPPPWAARRRIVIHAGRWVPREDYMRDLADDLALGYEPGVSRAQGERAVELFRQHWRDGSAFPIGAGLGTAFLGEPRCAREVLHVEALDLDPDGYVWPLQDPEPFAAPVPLAGGRGLWRWPTDAELDRRARQLALALAS